MSETKQSAFEGWAVVELFGHSREIGYVTTEAYGQCVMFRVDVPDLPEREFTLRSPEWANIDENGRQWVPSGSKVKREAAPGRTRLIGPAAVYAINPCTEEAARLAIEKNSARPLMLIELPPGKTLPPATEPIIDDDDNFEGDDDERDILEDD